VIQLGIHHARKKEKKRKKTERTITHLVKCLVIQVGVSHPGKTERKKETANESFSPSSV